jgi:hypothetical protein
MSQGRETILLCEGYHDRAFLQGALLWAGCTDPGWAPDGSRKPILDPGGRRVTGGHFAFLSKSMSFIRVQPCGGKPKIPSELERLLKEWPTRKYARIVVCVDSDDDARESTTSRPGLTWVDDRVKHADPKATSTSDGDLHIFDGELVVSAAAWWTTDTHTPELPWRQTLERLIVGALRDVYPDKATAVAAWLAGLPDGPKDGPKEHAWSHMAGWYADKGCEGFCRFVWDDAGVAAAMKRRLDACGFGRILEALAQ